MDSYAGKSEIIIRSAGCGKFQILIATFVSVVFKIPNVFAMLFMAFGNFNPGWKCLNNSASNTANNNNTGFGFENSTLTSPLSHLNNETTNHQLSYSIGSCDVFEKCHDVQFNPEVSTIVTEWGLTCDKYWITSVMISVQMTGVLVGCLLAGHLADLIGRKKVIYPAYALMGLLHLISMFSTNWQMFTAIRFFIGIMNATLITVGQTLISEFLDPIWRSRVALLPTWPTAGTLFVVAAMFCQDWVIIHIITAALSFLCCLTAVWVPESLRWLETQKKDKAFENVKKKIMSLNNLKNEISIKFQENKETLSNLELADKEVLMRKKYTMLDLFRKSYRGYSVIIGFQWFSFSLIYYANIFGAKNLHENIYISLIIMNLANIPLRFVAMLTINSIGRRQTAIILFAITSASLFVTAALELWAPYGTRKFGTLIFAVFAVALVGATWNVIRIIIGEIYPTVARGIAFSYGNLMARAGGMMAPILIPQTSESLYICFFVMSLLAAICSLLTFMLPETKGVNLKQTFDEDGS